LFIRNPTTTYSQLASPEQSFMTRTIVKAMPEGNKGQNKSFHETVRTKPRRIWFRSR
jgi:hypothetical protein